SQGLYHRQNGWLADAAPDAAHGGGNDRYVLVRLATRLSGARADHGLHRDGGFPVVPGIQCPIELPIDLYDRPVEQPAAALGNRGRDLPAVIGGAYPDRAYTSWH